MRWMPPPPGRSDAERRMPQPISASSGPISPRPPTSAERDGWRPPVDIGSWPATSRVRESFSSAALGEPAAERGTGRAEVLYRLAGVRQLMDDFVASMELGEEALRHAGEDPTLTIRIKLLLAGSSYISGRSWASGATHAFEAFALAEKSGDPHMVALTIGPFATWRYATGAAHDPELARRADELDPLTHQFRTLDLPQFDIGNIELQEGETARAVERLRLLLERAERDGDYSSLPFLLGNIGLGDFLEGRGDVARERLDRASRLAEATEQRVAQVHTRVWEARLAARLGDADRARQAGRDALDLMASTAWRSGEWLMRADLAALALSVGDPSSALAVAAPALEPPAEDESDRRRWALAAVVEALVALGRSDEARSALAVLDQLAAAVPLAAAHGGAPARPRAPAGCRRRLRGRRCGHRRGRGDPPPDRGSLGAGQDVARLR